MSTLDSESTSNQPSRLIGWFAFFLLFSFVVLITAKLLGSGALKSANDRSRWCAVYSLVEENTYQIDKIQARPGWGTIDIVRHNDHFYSTKPPLLPRLVAEIYRAVKAVTGMNLLDNTEAVARIILIIINIIPMTIAMWLMFKLIRTYCDNLFWQLFLMTATCWGTLLVPFLAVFNNHTIGTTFIIYSLYLAITIVAQEKESWWRFGLCGLFAAFGVCNELPAAAYGLGLFFILLKNNPKKTLLCFVPLALVPIGGFFLTNYHATGGWKPFYMYYGTEKYLFVFEGKPSYWLDPQGIDQGKDSFPVYLMHCLVGHHGIFSLSPIYLLTLGSWLTCFLWWKSKLRPFHLLGLALTFIVIAFYMTKTENYNYGGVSVALRWTLWLIPFWLLAMIPFLNRCGGTWFLKVPALAFLAVSLFSAWYPANSPWTQPWLYNVMEARGWIDYSVPRPKFDRKVYSWIGEIPEGEKQDDYWVELQTEAYNGETQIIRLQDSGPAEGGNRLITVTRNGEEKEYLFSRKSLEAGLPPVTFIHNRDGSEISEEDQTFFRGVPKRRPYASSRIRHIKTKVRTDAFKSHVGYTHTDVANSAGVMHRYQRDVWFSDEVPFGLFQFVDRVLDTNGKDVISRQVWEIRAAGKFLPRKQVK
ncbi:type 1 periplasmic-binding domain-containing protein [Thalassoglobus polymorphus]|nr:hypothetical protein [Thalassoglobus polymorphus]